MHTILRVHHVRVSKKTKEDFCVCKIPFDKAISRSTRSCLCTTFGSCAQGGPLDFAVPSLISPLKGCLLKVREMLLAPSQLSSNPVLPAATFVVVLLEVSQVWRSIYAHLEASAHMEDAVHGEDVRQEGIAQPLTRRRAPDICTAHTSEIKAVVSCTR